MAMETLLCGLLSDLRWRPPKELPPDHIQRASLGRGRGWGLLPAAGAGISWASGTSLPIWCPDRPARGVHEGWKN